MTPRFQADADFNQKIVRSIRRREPAVDFQSAEAGGIIGLPDTAVLVKAAGLGRILVSHDRRTMPVHFGSVVRELFESGIDPCPARPRYWRGS